MRCPQCNYRLWNLATRACPECGRPFKPSEFEFRPNTVEYCCPHCGHPHLGQGDKGHLATDRIPCDSCGRHIYLDDMLLRPAPGVDEDHAQFRRNPWFEAGTREFFRRYFTSVWLGAFHPRRAIEGVPSDQRLINTFCFLGLNLSLLPLLGGISLYFYVILTSSYRLDLGDLLFGSFHWASLTAFVWWTVGIIYFLIWGCSVHAILRILHGPLIAPLSRTYTALALTSGVHLLVALPFGLFLAPLIPLLWAAVAAHAVQEVHQTPRGLSLLAAIAFPLLLLPFAFALLA